MARPGCELNKEDNGFNFEKLVVYQKSLIFVNDVYVVTAKFPKEEKFALIDQFHRAAISVGLNIAEGCGNSDADFKRYFTLDVPAGCFNAGLTQARFLN